MVSGLMSDYGFDLVGVKSVDESIGDQHLGLCARDAHSENSRGGEENEIEVTAVLVAAEPGLDFGGTGLLVAALARVPGARRHEAGHERRGPANDIPARRKGRQHVLADRGEPCGVQRQENGRQCKESQPDFERREPEQQGRD